jgi:hypothetical protein
MRIFGEDHEKAAIPPANIDKLENRYPADHSGAQYSNGHMTFILFDASPICPIESDGSQPSSPAISTVSHCDSFSPCG